jgi:hypothetical protein
MLAMFSSRMALFSSPQSLSIVVVASKVNVVFVREVLVPAVPDNNKNRPIKDEMRKVVLGRRVVKEYAVITLGVWMKDNL